MTHNPNQHDFDLSDPSTGSATATQLAVLDARLAAARAEVAAITVPPSMFGPSPLGPSMAGPSMAGAEPTAEAEAAAPSKAARIGVQGHLDELAGAASQPRSKRLRWLAAAAAICALTAGALIYQSGQPTQLQLSDADVDASGLPYLLPAEDAPQPWVSFEGPVDDRTTARLAIVDGIPYEVEVSTVDPQPTRPSGTITADNEETVTLSSGATATLAERSIPSLSDASLPTLRWSTPSASPNLWVTVTALQPTTPASVLRVANAVGVSGDGSGDESTTVEWQSDGIVAGLSALGLPFRIDGTVPRRQLTFGSGAAAWFYVPGASQALDEAAELATDTFHLGDPQTMTLTVLGESRQGYKGFDPVSSSGDRSSPRTGVFAVAVGNDIILLVASGPIDDVRSIAEGLRPATAVEVDQKTQTEAEHYASDPIREGPDEIAIREGSVGSSSSSGAGGSGTSAWHFRMYRDASGQLMVDFVDDRGQWGTSLMGSGPWTVDVGDGATHVGAVWATKEEIPDGSATVTANGHTVSAAVVDADELDATYVVALVDIGDAEAFRSAEIVTLTSPDGSTATLNNR